jgi:colanic acid/amylovoran biosynthesis glycosyltransferase
MKLGFGLPDVLVQYAAMSRVLRLLNGSRRSIRYARNFVKWRLFMPVATLLYNSVLDRLSWWPLDWSEKDTRWHSDGERRIVYYLWLFPALSETFIQREIRALRNAGVSVEVIAHELGHYEFLGEEAKALIKHTHYLRPAGRAELLCYAVQLFSQKPFVFTNAFFYTVFCRYDRRKSFRRDFEVFARAVHLARALKQKRADHVHAPWASIDAFVAMISARLLKIPYTVQARAYDIHRHSSAVGREAKLSHAAFVITNSKYNESIIRSLLSRNHVQKIRAIYNGIDLHQFQPRNRQRLSVKNLKILSVGNLVEPKGFEYLMHACKLLKESGYVVSCQIIGGRVATELNYYIKLQKFRKTLALEEEVLFLGRQPFAYVLQKYEEADLFVLPAVTASHGGRDITPNALIEAMAMKLPVVSTWSGAIPEIVEDGINGFLVPPRDEQALAQAIIRLLTNPTLAEELGTNARKKVEERFNINKNISQFVTLFREGIENSVRFSSRPSAVKHQEELEDVVGFSKTP